VGRDSAVMPQQLPAEFVKNITGIHKEKGVQWLEDLPYLLTQIATQWDLEISLPVENLSFNYVAPVRKNGQELILKIGVLHPELTSEIAALRLYAGHGMVKMLAVDEAKGAFLLEKLPGPMLATLFPNSDAEATQIAARIMQRLWRPVPENKKAPFPHIADWLAGLQNLRPKYSGSTGPFPEAMIVEIERLIPQLLATSPGDVLLHGDLHHYNMMQTQDGDTNATWCAIDPKGIIGEPAYEIGAFLYNPFGVYTHPDLENILARRLAQFSDILAIDKQRLRDWALVTNVLSCWWNIEDSDTEVEANFIQASPHWLHCAEAIFRL
jgi:streptomycin 6-kinase